ncbi:MAG: FeoB-associated Cys-rich membrane protein [Clostridia bacterium]|nr:FeoB-associated Cys-rich membrane protein [Clostridia bacterium]
MENYIIIAIIVAILGSVIFYLFKAKKRGDKCIGCPYAKECGGKCSEFKK